MKIGGIEMKMAGEENKAALGNIELAAAASRKTAAQISRNGGENLKSGKRVSISMAARAAPAAALCARHHAPRGISMARSCCALRAHRRRQAEARWRRAAWRHRACHAPRAAAQRHHRARAATRIFLPAARRFFSLRYTHCRAFAIMPHAYYVFCRWRRSTRRIINIFAFAVRAHVAAATCCLQTTRFSRRARVTVPRGAAALKWREMTGGGVGGVKSAASKTRKTSEIIGGDKATSRTRRRVKRSLARANAAQSA